MSGPGRRATARPRHAGAFAAAIMTLATSLAVAPAVAASAATSQRSAPLPRVFFTPAERARITAARLAGRSMSASTAAAEAQAPQDVRPSSGGAVDLPRSAGDELAPAVVRTARVDGVTLGQGAAAAVWIGGQRIADGGRWGRWRVQVRRDGARLLGPGGTTREVRVGMELQP